MMKPKQPNQSSLADETLQFQNAAPAGGDDALRNLEATLDIHFHQFERILQAILDTKTVLETKINTVSLEVGLLRMNHWRLEEQVEDTELGLSTMRTTMQDLHTQNKQCVGKLYVAEKGQLILGWPHIKKLSLKIDSTRLPPVYPVLEHDLQKKLIYDELDKRFPTVFSESLGLEVHGGLDRGSLTEQEWNQKMVKDNEMQVVKGYILNGWPGEGVLRVWRQAWNVEWEVVTGMECGRTTIEGEASRRGVRGWLAPHIAYLLEAE
ncbi:hypothetical protein NDU88_005669 [Pleurodeles waltl]|uniref:Uncharacterized protein n=1 Tax=Pleurodeles waltl TaxID=8319 RepID=A0AAV7MX25_PLEWA|nr:hypothetical protein NDU88_005669 [Pleurodeles waltl]